MSSRRISLLLSALAVFGLVGMTSLAGFAGARSGAKTTVTIKYNGDGFQGKVKSARSKCVSDRKVKVFKKKAGADQKIDAVTSDPDGHWDTGNSGQAHGRFYAKATKTTGCRAGTSPTIKV